MLESLKVLRATINVGVFPSADVEKAARNLIDKMNAELNQDADGVAWEEGADVLTAVEELNSALDEVAAAEDFDEDEDEDEVEEDEEARSN